MESSTEPVVDAKKEAKKAARKAALAAKRKVARAAKRKADKAAKKVAVNFAEEKAELELAGWLTVQEVAKMLRLTPRRVRDFLLKGRLPAMRVSRTWYVQRKDVLEFSGIERKPGRQVAEK